MKSEINATLSEYVPPEEIEQAFQLTSLPRGWGVAPNQPNPVMSAVWQQWILYLLGIALIYVSFPVFTHREIDLPLTLWAAALVSTIPLASLAYSHSFERRRWQDSEYNPYSVSDGDDDE